MADTSNQAPQPTGNWLIDSLQGLANVGGSILTTAASFQERLLAAKAAAAQKTATPQQVVTVPNTNPNADPTAAIQTWATYAAVTGGILLVLAIIYKKVK